VILSTKKLMKMASPNADPANVKSFLAGLNKFGAQVGLDKPHRLAQYLGQMMHESANFRYDRELWGPTPAQKRYDTRTDLGNTAAKDGDGKKYAGRTAIQITGRDNYEQFTAWAKMLDKRAPDFVANPDAANTDPWEGLGPIWYWDTRNLNKWADVGDLRSVTKRINGGYNGLKDREARYTRAALVLLGYESDAVREFQIDRALTTDGVAGKNTRAALHKALVGLPALGASTKAPAVIATGGAVALGGAVAAGVPAWAIGAAVAALVVLAIIIGGRMKK